MGTGGSDTIHEKRRLVDAKKRTTSMNESVRPGISGRAAMGGLCQLRRRAFEPKMARSPFPLTQLGRRRRAMSFHHLNFPAVLVAAMSTMPVGFLWNSPALFAKPWMKEMGYDPND